jgi:Flp pilus assembly protein TadD
VTRSTSATAQVRVRALAALGDLLRSQGRYAESERHFRGALRVAERHLGAKRLQSADLCNGLAITCKYSGRFEDAERLYRRALSILERVHGPDHPDVASLYHNLGGLRHARGDYAAGLVYARRSVAIRERALGADHVDAAADSAALAALLDAVEEEEEAEHCCGTRCRCSNATTAPCTTRSRSR